MYILLVDGNWSPWYNSGGCTRSCGAGSQHRVRSCNNPSQANCGAHCQGDDNDYISCLISACPGNLIFLHLFYIMIYFERYYSLKPMNCMLILEFISDICYAYT